VENADYLFWTSRLPNNEIIFLFENAEVQMRRFVFALLLPCWLCTFAAAQSVNVPVESFDRSGIPAKPQTQAERDLLRRMSSHRRGNVADAVDIQRKLADYYRAKGDLERARMAEQRAYSVPGYGTPAPGYGTAAPGYERPVPSHGRVPGYGTPVPGYGMGPVAVPPQNRAPAAKPAYGAPLPSAQKTGDPAPDSISVPAYQPEEGQAAPAADAAPKGEPDLVTPPEEPPQLAPQPAQSPEFSGRYYALQGNTLHTWEFRPDGSFQHAWTLAGAAPTDAANFEIGNYRVAGPYLMMTVVRGSTAQPLGAGARQFRMQMRGPSGRDGLMMNGILLRPKMP